MGQHEGCAEPCGIMPNGLLPNAGPVIRVLDSDRWLKAEERTAELIACIQPNPPSEGRRNAVADYVQRLIRKCFPCQVFTFGSVPLKTYLPDGDIDVTAFSNNQNLKDTWANYVCDMLESEEKNENAEFRVKEVQYIQAEVKIIKCLVENIVVDISFNQLGGLCTLCFLEEVDQLINQNHLLKRSIILIKAWCYYESRILGAHHGLISTYALETLVLYVFHVFSNSFTGPLEVLYCFLEFFSNFDWDNFCVSLWGPVHISSLPDVTAEPPRKDSGESILSKLFLDACSSVYSVFPGGQENQGQHFVSKHFNVIDPLRVNNNIGCSVSKGNFFRIRSAFAFGAKRLARLVDCAEETLGYEVNQFFMNTWDRHGSGNRPDAPRTDLSCLRLSTPDHLHGPENMKNNPSAKNLNENSSGRDDEVDGTHSCDISSQHGNYYLESRSRTIHSSAATRCQSQKTYGNLNSSWLQELVGKEVSSNLVMHIDKGQTSVRSDHLVNEIQGRFLFARTRSSPELTDTYSDGSIRGMCKETPASGKAHVTCARQDSNRRNNPGSEFLVNHSTQSYTNDPSSVRHMPFDQSFDASAGSNSGLYSHHYGSSSPAMVEEFSSVSGSQGRHQEGQDLVSMMPSRLVHSLNGRVHVPLNLSSARPPLPMSPSILASVEYAQRNLAEMIPPNIPIDPSFSNMQFPHGFSSLTHYFPGIELTPNLDETIEPCNKIFGSAEINPGETDHDFWQEQDVGSTGGFEPDSGNYEMLQLDDKPQSSSASLNAVHSSHLSGSGTSMRVRQKFNKENPRQQEHYQDSFQHQDNRGNAVYFDDRTTGSMFSSAVCSSSIRSKTSSESSWDGSSPKVSKSTREKWGKQPVLAEPSSVYGKSENVSERTYAEEDDRDWSSLSTMSSEMVARTSGAHPVGSVHGLRQHVTGYELAQTNGSDSMIPIAPVIVGPGSRQRLMDNSGAAPFTFYPTGPPIPFFTMLNVYNIPPETGTCDASKSQFAGEEGLDSSESGHNFDSSEELDQSEEVNSTNTSTRADFVEISDEHKSHILNSDLASHWKNLQYGRFCQNPRSHGPLIYSSPAAVPPAYLQGHCPWDGPGKPLSGDMNVFSQLMGYSPLMIPVAPLQSVSTRPPNVYQRRYADEMPRYRSGTGTYLPNPKVSVRDRHSSGARRGNYKYDKSDNYGDGEGNRNISSKSRASGRNHGRNQSEKSNSRLERLASNENRADRSWRSYRHDSVPSYQSQHVPLRSNSSQGVPSNVTYGMYPLPAMNLSGVPSNGPTGPSVAVIYPFDLNAGYSSQSEQLEFGSLGPLGLSNTNKSEQPQLSEVSQAKQQWFHKDSMQRSSPDQPSSCHFRRRV